MVNPESAVAAKLDAFIEMVRIRDQALLEELWGDGKFFMVGSEAGEICRTRSELAAKLSTIFRHASTIIFDFPRRTVEIAGSVAWVVAEGTAARREADGTEQSSQYIACCIFEHVDDVWRWRQFFGSEPR
jgi:ketosteroid isomerase-like protein